MKRITKVFLSIALLFTSGCNNKKVESRFLLEGNFDATSYVELYNNDLSNKLDNEDSFILYIHVEGCSSCKSFEDNALNPFILETHSIIYGIDSSILDNSKVKYSTCPTISIIKEGKVIKTYNYKKTNKMYKDKDKLKEEITNYSILPNLLTINEDSLDNMIKNKGSFILYIGWNKCGDCKLLNEEILNDYLKNDSFEDKMYYLESDSYRNGRKSSLEECTTQEEIDKYNNWLEFAEKYKFRSYLNGKIPALVYYKNGVFIELLVYHNDVIENGKVTTSFFQEIIGKKMDDNQLIEYHNLKVKEFLRKYHK